MNLKVILIFLTGNFVVELKLVFNKLYFREMFSELECPSYANIYI